MTARMATWSNYMVHLEHQKDVARAADASRLARQARVTGVASHRLGGPVIARLGRRLVVRDAEATATP